MGRKRTWIYQEARKKVRGLKKGETYSFNPRFQTDGSVKCKVLGDALTQKITFGYASTEAFREDWTEVKGEEL